MVGFDQSSKFKVQKEAQFKFDENIYRIDLAGTYVEMTWWE